MKYTQGDYLLRPDSVYFEVVAAYDGTVPIYLMLNHKDNSCHWLSEFELEVSDFKKDKGPDFDKWAGLKEGDMVSCGSDTHIHRVIARIGDAFLMSQDPTDPKELKTITNIQEQIHDLTTDNSITTIVDDMVKGFRGESPFDKTRTASGALKSVFNSEWHTVKQGALFNWKIIDGD